MYANRQTRKEFSFKTVNLGTTMLSINLLYFLNFYSWSHKWKVILAQGYPPRRPLYAIILFFVVGRVCRLEAGSVVGHHFIGRNGWLQDGRWPKLGQSEPFFRIFQTNTSGQMLFWKDPWLPSLSEKEQDPRTKESCSTRWACPRQISVSGVSHTQDQLHFCHVQPHGSILPFVLWGITPGSLQ